ncbi:hypothetical protein AGMMS49983_07270 [Clostridia bacterium]|nr:hypothetical protein AGMMS49983_07270 [Clostridia bacterium]
MNRLAKIARRIGLIAALAAMTILFAMPVFAAGGTLDFTSESNGKDNVPIENVGFKLYFTSNGAAATMPFYDGKDDPLFDLHYTSQNKDEDGNVIKEEVVRVPVKVYSAQQEGAEDYVLVLADPAPVKEGYPGQLQQKTNYELTVKGDLATLDGTKLGNDKTIQFTTLDVAANSKLSMIVMVLMMVAVIALMVVTNGRKVKAEAEAAALMKANPYKIAKERNITVDEAKTLIEKAKEKNRKQLEKVGGKVPEPEPPKGAVPRIESKAKKKKPTHKVAGPGSALAGGSKYAAAHKAEAERKRRAAAAKKAAKARQQQSGGAGAAGAKKSSSSKGKGKKK